MRETVDYEFAWELFKYTGNIESYLLYNEYKNMQIGKNANENNANNGACAQSSKYE